MYAQLGPIVFERLIGFSTYEMTGAEKYAEHALINLQPRLAHTGTELRVIKFDVLYHADFCVPEQEIAQLWANKNGAAILTLVLGNGRIIGDFVITDLTENIDQTLSDGTYVQVRYNVQLKECVIPDPSAQQDVDAKNNSAANTSRKPAPVRVYPPQYANIYLGVNAAMLELLWRTNEIEYLVVFAASNPTQFLMNSLLATDELSAMADKIQFIGDFVTPAYQAGQEAAAGFIDWAADNSNILTNATICGTSVTSLLGLMPMTTINITSVQAALNNLQNNMAALKLAFSNNIIQNALRRL